MKVAFITQRESIGKNGEKIDSLEKAYVEYLSILGFLCVPISNFLEKPCELFETSEEKILVLTGGGSLPPEFYAAAYGYERQAERDVTEESLLAEAFKKDIPVLAICRGMQFVNGYLGGKVTKLETVGAAHKPGEDHLVRDVLGTEAMVNSFHNDGVLKEDLAPGLEVFAMDSGERVAEAFTMRGHRLLALQWHPERDFKEAAGKKYSDGIVKEFLEGKI